MKGVGKVFWCRFFNVVRYSWRIVKRGKKIYLGRLLLKEEVKLGCWDVGLRGGVLCYSFGIRMRIMIGYKGLWGYRK